jgi:hypothetical protein
MTRAGSALRPLPALGRTAASGARRGTPPRTGWDDGGRRASPAGVAADGPGRGVRVKQAAHLTPGELAWRWRMSPRTAERIRDEVAASRKKGMWMGGVPPFGYRVENRKLDVDEGAAEHVRWIFGRFLEIGACTELAR